MTVRDAQRSIEPASTGSGDRQVLEQGLADVLGGSGGEGGGGPAAPEAGGGVSIPEDPLGSLLSGEVPADDLPVTDGLSVGAGVGSPDGPPASMTTPRAEKLRDLSQNASVPGVRQAARDELRRMFRQAV